MKTVKFNIGQIVGNVQIIDISIFGYVCQIPGQSIQVIYSENELNNL